MKELHAAVLREVRNDVVVSSQQPLRSQQSFDSYRSACMDTRSADPNLGTESEAIPIREARAGVPEDTRTVHVLQEELGSFLVFCDDNIGVRTAVLVDMFNSLSHTVHHLNAACQVPIFSAERFHFRGAEGQVGGKLGAGVNLHLRQQNYAVIVTTPTISR